MQFNGSRGELSKFDSRPTHGNCVRCNFQRNIDSCLGWLPSIIIFPRIEQSSSAQRHIAYFCLILITRFMFNPASQRFSFGQPNLPIPSRNGNVPVFQPWWRVNARNVSFINSLRWPIYIINLVRKTKLSCNTSSEAAPQFL